MYEVIKKFYQIWKLCIDTEDAWTYGPGGPDGPMVLKSLKGRPMVTRLAAQPTGPIGQSGPKVLVAYMDQVAPIKVDLRS